MLEKSSLGCSMTNIENIQNKNIYFITDREIY